METLLLPTFRAAHLLAFGTDYWEWHYFEEAAKRLIAGETITWGFDDAYYLNLLKDSVQRGAIMEAATLYADTKGTGANSAAMRLRHAASILHEAAIRGELSVLGIRHGDTTHQFIALDRTNFIDRPRLSYSADKLDKAIRDGSPDFHFLRFNRDEVMRLRSAPWHTISHAAPANEAGPAPEQAVEPSLGELPYTDMRRLLAAARALAERGEGLAVRGMARMLLAQEGPLPSDPETLDRKIERVRGSLRRWVGLEEIAQFHAECLDEIQARP